MSTSEETKQVRFKKDHTFMNKFYKKGQVAQATKRQQEKLKKLEVI